MGQYQIGDRVRCVAMDIGTVLGPTEDYYFVQLDGSGVVTCHCDHLRPHVDTFPIEAEKDPWRESERNARGKESSCLARGPGDGSFCDRIEGHSGYHVERDRRGNVLRRWPPERRDDAGFFTRVPCDLFGEVIGIDVTTSSQLLAESLPNCVPAARLTIPAQNATGTTSAGGDIIFQTGRGLSPSGSLPPLPDGSFRFNLADGTEVLRIDGDGKISVRGNVVDDDESVYQGFRAWLMHARTSMVLP